MIYGDTFDSSLLPFEDDFLFGGSFEIYAVRGEEEFYLASCFDSDVSVSIAHSLIRKLILNGEKFDYVRCYKSRSRGNTIVRSLDFVLDPRDFPRIKQNRHFV